MKLALPAAALVLMTAVACSSNSSKKPTASNNVTDLTPPPAPAPAPIAVAPAPAPTTPVVADATPVAATPAVATTPESPSSISGNKYTVQKGDTLWKIAAAKYGDGKSYKKIIAANPGLTPASLKVGQTITLP